MNTSELYNIFEEYPSICTDSREIKKDSLFFALKGNNFNGNEFAEQAISDGCRFAFIDELDYQTENCILVNDVLETLQSLSSFHRDQLNIPIIGITGTNGKTTTKELINSTLSSIYNCYSTKGNLNNHIGVPLSLLEITKQTDIAVIEIGANHLGEIELLCNLAKPTHGIITNIGMAHLEGFGNFDGVIKAKSELYNFIKKSNGKLFVNANDRLLMNLSKDCNKILYGMSDDSDYQGKIISSFPFVNLEINDISIQSNLIGNFQVDNILSSSCIAHHFKVSLDKIKRSIEDYIPSNNRTQVIETKNNFLILDAYNANPTSMKCMIESFSGMNRENKICILGDMLELGEYSEKEHKEIVKLTNKLNLDTVFIGHEFSKVNSENTYKTNTEYKEYLTQHALKNRSILLKGSRGIKLENLVENL